MLVASARQAPYLACLRVLRLAIRPRSPTIPFPRERDQVIMEIVLERTSATAEIQSLNRCRGMLQCIFLSDLVTADGRYLESSFLTQDRSSGIPTIASQENAPHKKIGKHGSIFGTTMFSRGTNWMMQGNIWSVLRRPEPPIPMLFPSHFSSPQRFLFSLA